MENIHIQLNAALQCNFIVAVALINQSIRTVIGGNRADYTANDRNINIGAIVLIPVSPTLIAGINSVFIPQQIQSIGIQRPIR